MKRAIILLLGLFFAVVGPAQAKWPERSVTLIVPFTPGTGIDVIARQLSVGLQDKLGEAIVVENLPGASGNIGTEKAVRARPDGQTFLVTVNTLVMNASLYKDTLPYDPVEDLAPVGLTSWGSLLLVTHPDNDVNTVADVIAATQEKPGEYTYGTPGVGTPHHLSMALFANLTDTDMLHVPYKGTSGAVTDLLAGRVDYMFMPVHVALPQIESGKLKVIATGSPERLPQLPEVPTLAEAGLEGADVDMWYGVLAPKDTPREIIDAMNAAMAEVLDNPKVDAAFDAQGMVRAHSSPEEFAALIAKDAQRWDQLITEAQITAE